MGFQIPDPPEIKNQDFDLWFKQYIKVIRENLLRYVDRGDPAAYDYAAVDFTCDDTWRDLDLSSIVPVGATAVQLLVQIQDDQAASLVRFRKNGNTNTVNFAAVRTQVANIPAEFQITVFCDTGRVIEYKGEAGLSLTLLNVAVVGWWI